MFIRPNKVKQTTAHSSIAFGISSSRQAPSFNNVHQKKTKAWHWYHVLIASKPTTAHKQQDKQGNGSQHQYYNKSLDRTVYLHPLVFEASYETVMFLMIGVQTADPCAWQWMILGVDKLKNTWKVSQLDLPLLSLMQNRVRKGLHRWSMVIG